MRLNIKDIINNVKDELERAREMLQEHCAEEAENSMLISDIDSSLERMEDITERIEFALMIAVYAGGIQNSYSTYEDVDVDNADWREKYLNAASQIELEYEDGYVCSDWAYDNAYMIAEKLLADS